MTAPPPRSPGTRPSQKSPRPLPLVRLPLLMRLFAVISLLAGMWGAVSSLAELLAGVRADRTVFISRVHDRQLALYDKLQPGAAAAATSTTSADSARPGARPLLDIEPLLHLPRPEFEHLSLLLGDELYEQLPVAVPLALLQLLLSWLLLTAALGVLRRQGWALSMWSWACMVNIPFALLSITVTLVHSRAIREHLLPPVAEALAKSSGRPVATELYGLQQLVRLYVGGQAALLALWVLLLGATALYLQRYQTRSAR